MEGTLILYFAIILLLPWAAFADDLQDAYAACQQHHVAVINDHTLSYYSSAYAPGFEGCAQVEQLYAQRPPPPPAVAPDAQALIKKALGQ